MYNLVTSMDNKIVSCGIIVSARKLNFMKSVVSLTYDFCRMSIGCSKGSTNYDILLVGPSQPEIISLLTGFGLWNLVT